MGCDIHVFVERRTEKGWRAVRPASDWDAFLFDYGHDSGYEWEVGRNYALFARLAGVRNQDDVTPLATPRGLPVDIDEPTRERFSEWNGDAHSMSWLGDLELMGDRAAFGETWSRFVREVTGRRPARIVFWFDN